MKIEQEILNLINLQRSSINLKPKLFVSEDKYSELIKSIEPKYKKLYGALIVDKETFEEGFENVIFQGAIIICGPIKI